MSELLWWYLWGAVCAVVGVTLGRSSRAGRIRELEVKLAHARSALALFAWERPGPASDTPPPATNPMEQER